MVEVVVGMGATEVMYSDCNPWTVIEVITPKKIIIQADDYKLVSGEVYNGSADYEYIQNPNNHTKVLRLNKRNRWKEIGSPDGSTFAMGGRRRYYDPSF